jgi:hypothetical protein
MSTRMTRRTRLSVEALEGRVALSTMAHAAHAAPTTPVLVDLTPEQTGFTITQARVDPRIGVVTIRGTVTPVSFFPGPFPGPPTPLPSTSTSVFVAVTQPVNRLQSVTGFGSTFAVSNAPGQPAPFTVLLTASNGRFGHGLATLSLFPSSGPFGFGGSEMVVVRLRPARLS